MSNLQGLYRMFSIVLSVMVVVLISPLSGYSYVGPGAGLSVVGTIIALIAAIILAVVGFVWYPIKRILAKWKGNQKTPE